MSRAFRSKPRQPHFLLVLFVSAILLASCAKFGRPDDAVITTDIKAKMFSNPSLKSANVDVSSRGGEVTLTGQVPDDSARLAAFKIASETKGVAKVNDQMTVLAAQATPPPAAAPPPEAMPGEPAPAKPPARKPMRSEPPTSPEPSPGTGPGDMPPVVSTDSAPVPQPAAPVPAPAPTVAPAPPPPPQPRTVTVPAGAIITVRTIDPVDSATNTTGQIFKASLDAPIVVDNRVVVPRGADVYMKLINASSAGHLKGKSELTLALQSVVFQGKAYTVVTSDVSQSGASRGKNSAMKIGGGAVLGALIGGLAGGGKGAAIGAAAGGGAGTGLQVFTKGKQIKIPSETRLDFTLQQPFDITYFPSRKSRGASTGGNANQPAAVPNASSDQPPAN
jgi:BON domain